jgi:hypothetical protein|tara:strand:- start:200 stop:688 length:489 start_codon:yes stop_codon:yes gene_type:complete
MKRITYILILVIFFGCKSENKKVNTEKEAITESPINGKWKVINSTILPFEHISYCKKLELNSVFEFKKDRTLSVYETINGKTCTKNQTFKVRGKKLEIFEWDMIFDYEIMELTAESLKLKIKRTPSYYWTESNLNDEKIKTELEEIKENGIIITLEKIKNGG